MIFTTWSEFLIGLGCALLGYLIGHFQGSLCALKNDIVWGDPLPDGLTGNFWRDMIRLWNENNPGDEYEGSGTVKIGEEDVDLTRLMQERALRVNSWEHDCDDPQLDCNEKDCGV